MATAACHPPYAPPALSCTQVCAAGDARLLDDLIHYGLDVNCTDFDGRTGLHVAAEVGEHAVVRVLLRRGAEPSRTDGYGFTPLLEAVRHEHVTIAREIHASGGRLGLEDSSVAAPPAAGGADAHSRSAFGASGGKSKEGQDPAQGNLEAKRRKIKVSRRSDDL